MATRGKRTSPPLTGVKALDPSAQLDSLFKRWGVTPVPAKTVPTRNKETYGPPVPKSVAKKLVDQELKKATSGSFLGNLAHGVTSLPGDVVHAAGVVGHGVKKEAPVVARKAARAAEVAQALNPNPHLTIDRHGHISIDPGSVTKAPGRIKGGAEGAAALGAVVGPAALKGYESLVRGAGTWAGGIGAHPGNVTRPQEEGITPPAVGKAVENVLAGGAGAVASLRHPKHAITDVAKGSVGALVGVSLMFGAADSMTDPNTSFAEKKAAVKEPLMSVAEALQKAYGPDVSVTDAFKAGMQNPFFYGTNAWTALSAGASGLAAIRNVLELGRDATIGDMVRAARSIRVPKNPRTLRIKVEGGTPEVVTVPSSRSPLYRGTVSKGYDLSSRLLGSVPGLRRLPWSETPRAVRAKRRQLDRQERRLPAEARSIYRDVAEFVNQHGNRHYSAALATLLQKPVGFTDHEWMAAAMQDIQTMLDTGRFVGPEEKITPGVQRLLNRVRSYQAKEEAARSQRLSRASYRVSQHQTNLANALDDINTRRSQLTDERKTVADDPTIPDEEKQAELALYDEQIRALNSQAKVARSELNDLTVNREPVDHPNRDQYVNVLEQIPYFKENPEAVADVVAMVDARAHVWSGQTGRPASEYWSLIDTRLVRPEDIPSDAYKQIAFNLRRNIAPETAQQNLRYVPGGDLYKPERARPTNRKHFRTLKTGERVQVLGPITPEEWVKRVVAVVRDKETRDKLARWYEQVAPTFEHFFGSDAEAILRGFAVSQANASPTFGLTATMRVFDKVRRGEEISPTEISAVVKSIEAAVKNEHVSSGLAAKLHDFADAIEGKQTRTWMGDNPAGGAPSPNDIHAIRDQGYVDPKIVQRLLQPESNALFKKGFKEGDFTVDSASTAGTHQYQRMTEKYQEITDHLNATAFDGRTDWTPAQVQALGWSAIQRLHGANPEDLAIAASNNTRRIALEVTKGRSGIGNDLTLAEATQVARTMEGPVRNLVESIPGLYLEGGLETTVSAYEGATNASIHFDVLGSPEKVHDLVTTLADTFDQYDVWALRESTTNKARPTLILDHPDLADPEKAVALYNELHKADPKRYAGFLQTETKDGTPAIALVLPGKRPIFSTAHDAKLAELQPQIDAAIERAFGPGYDVGGRITNHEVIDREWRGGKGHAADQPGLAGAGPERAVQDRAAAEARQRLEDTVAAVREGRAPPEAGQGRVSNQTRQADILGASQWLGTPDGKRIIYLTENADLSTVVHELVGHATDELRTFYPQEFAKVEEQMGKVYADWSVADHEQFAQWAEQYFRSGLAPTPELSPVLSRMKTWMRSIYAGISRLLGSRMPYEARVLFDSYFGAYDDENVARIALNMGLEETSRESLQIERYGGAKSITQDELRTLKKRVETRRYNRSLDGMVNRLDELTKELDDLRKNQKEWTPEQADEYTRLSADVLRQQAEIVVRADKREQALRRKLSDLEKSLQKGVDSRGFQAALEAMKWLSADRERILRETFGSDYDLVFSGRRDLLADWLVSRGLLEPDFEQGTGFYFPHTLDSALLKSGIKGPAYSLVGNVVGKTKMDLLKLHKRNQMILWQRGDWNADPAVLLEAHFRAQGYDWMNQVKQSLYDVGRPLTFEEAQNLPKNVYLINPHGTPVSTELRQQLKSAMGTEDAQRVHDGIEGMSNADLEANLKGYWDAFAIDPKQLPAGFNASELPDLRVVPKSVVHGILRPLSGGENPFGKAWDVGTTVARMATIYANVPAYMFANAVGNTAFLFAHQGLFLPRALKDAYTLRNNRRLYERIQAETGEVPLMSMIERGRGFSKTLQYGEKKLLGFESVVDRIPRALAWMHEARNHGYRTPQKMLELLDGKTAKTRADRELVAEASTQHMVDFNRAGPHERMALARILFIWPWVRGATAYPFWYAKNYPVRAGIAANIGLAETQRQKDILGAVPPWYQGLYPISRQGERAQVINTNPISPTGTAADSLRLIEDTVASALGRKPDTQTAALLNNFNPLLKDLISFATHKDAFGNDQSLQQALGGTVVDFVPGWRIVRAMRQGDVTPRAFRKYDRDFQDRTMRTFVRIAPQTVTVPWLNAQAYRAGTKSTSEKIDEAIATAEKDWGTIEKGKPFPGFVRRGVEMKVVYEDRLAAFAKEREHGADFVPSKPSSVKYMPTPYEQAKIMYAVVKQYYPAATVSKNGQPPHVPTPEAILAHYKDDPEVGFVPPPDSAAGKLVMGRYLSTVEKAFFAPGDKVTSNAKKKIQAGQVEKQKQKPAAVRRRAQLAATP